MIVVLVVLVVQVIPLQFAMRVNEPDTVVSAPMLVHNILSK